jgi:hypothetical protein
MIVCVLYYHNREVVLAYMVYPDSKEVKFINHTLPQNVSLCVSAFYKADLDANTFDVIENCSDNDYYSMFYGITKKIRDKTWNVKTSIILKDLEVKVGFGDDIYRDDYTLISATNLSLDRHIVTFIKHSQTLKYTYLEEDKDLVTIGKLILYNTHNAYNMDMNILNKCKIWYGNTMGSVLYNVYRGTHAPLFNLEYYIKTHPEYKPKSTLPYEVALEIVTLHSLTQINNICVHHCTLCGYSFTDQPSIEHKCKAGLLERTELTYFDIHTNSYIGTNMELDIPSFLKSKVLLLITTSTQETTTRLLLDTLDVTNSIKQRLFIRYNLPKYK